MNLTPCTTCDWTRRVSHAGADCGMHQRLACLASNLAIGAGLCKAFRLGDDFGAWTEDPYPDPAPWRPGCGKALTEQPRTVATLARQLGTTKSAIERDIKTLSAVFAVTSAPSPKHKQRRLYAATMNAASRGEEEVG